MHETFVFVFSTYIQLFLALFADRICDTRVTQYGICVVCLSLVCFTHEMQSNIINSDC